MSGVYVCVLAPLPTRGKETRSITSHSWFQMSHFEELKLEQRRHQEHFQERLVSELQTLETHPGGGGGLGRARTHGLFGGGPDGGRQKSGRREDQTPPVEETVPPKVHMFDPFGIQANSLTPKQHQSKLPYQSRLFCAFRGKLDFAP